MAEGSEPERITNGHAHFLLPTPISTHDAQYTQFQLIPVAFYSTYEKGPYRAINDF